MPGAAVESGVTLDVTAIIGAQEYPPMGSAESCRQALR